MIGFLITMLVIGLLAGIVARALVPGRDPMSVGKTILLGVAGSYIGGFLGYVLFHHNAAAGAFQPSGLFGSIVGGVIALLIYRAKFAGRVATPGTRR